MHQELSKQRERYTAHSQVSLQSKWLGIKTLLLGALNLKCVDTNFYNFTSYNVNLQQLTDDYIDGLLRELYVNAT